MILGCSADSPKKNCNFADKLTLGYSLLCDTEHTLVIEPYGAWGRKKFMGREYDGIFRSTYAIDENGVIAAAWPNVKVKGHDEEVLAAL